MDLATVARRLCLQNAAEHGQCDPKRLMGRVMASHPEFRGDAGAVMQALQAAAAEVNAMDVDTIQATLEAEAPDLLETKKRERREGLKPLPEVDGKPVLRFAPNPNGPLTLGHARGVSVMAEYARMQDADVVLRFDDTDPQVKPPLYRPKEGIDAYQWIEDDWTWLAGRGPDRVVKASDRIDLYHEHARKLIHAGGAYVCTCDAEAWREAKNRGEACEHREQAAGDGIDLFDRMVVGQFLQGQAVLRVKTNIQHKDPALRDWTAFRIVAADAVHPREAAGEIGHHVCWPLLDFQSAVEDHLQGVTHVIRGKDLMDSTRKQAFLYEHMGWTYPHTLYWGRIKIHEFGSFSTSAMRRDIEAGKYTGWDDPRLPTIRALRRRGYDPEAVRSYWVSLGLSEKDIAVSMENMDAHDGKVQDARTPRFFFVPRPTPLPATGLEGRIARPLVNPNDEGAGHRELPGDNLIHVAADDLADRFRLKDMGNVEVDEGTAVWDGEELDRSIPIVQWLPQAHAAPFRVLRPQGDELGEDAGLVEPAALEHIGGVVQFERYGFVRIESQDRGVWLHA